MKSFALLVAAFFAAGIPAATHTDESRPLAFVGSDLNPKSVFWIQGRFVPVDDPTFQGGPAVGTVLCSARENECLEIDGTVPFNHAEQLWVQEYKVISWDQAGIGADSRSLDGCTDGTLKIRFAPPTVTVINSPVLPISEKCKEVNDAWDKLGGKKGSALKGQMEQDMLVPTRGLFPFQDSDLNVGKVSVPSEKKRP